MVEHDTMISLSEHRQALRHAFEQNLNQKDREELYAKIDNILPSLDRERLYSYSPYKGAIVLHLLRRSHSTMRQLVMYDLDGFAHCEDPMRKKDGVISLIREMRENLFDAFIGYPQMMISGRSVESSWYERRFASIDYTLSGSIVCIEAVFKPEDYRSEYFQNLIDAAGENDKLARNTDDLAFDKWATMQRYSLARMLCLACADGQLEADPVFGLDAETPVPRIIGLIDDAAQLESGTPDASEAREDVDDILDKLSRIREAGFLPARSVGFLCELAYDLGDIPQDARE